LKEGPAEYQDLIDVIGLQARGTEFAPIG